MNNLVKIEKINSLQTSPRINLTPIFLLHRSCLAKTRDHQLTRLSCGPLNTWLTYQPEKRLSRPFIRTMKRPRPERNATSNHKESEPLAVAPTINGPLSDPSSWSDFWIDVVAYLPQRNMYHLSCTSKTLNSWVWQSISSSAHGLVFNKATHHPIVLKYLKKTPNLQNLKFLGFGDYSAVHLFTCLQNLTSFSYEPAWYQKNGRSPVDAFPFLGESHPHVLLLNFVS